jgi:hypothetical protein
MHPLDMPATAFGRQGGKPQGAIVRTGWKLGVPQEYIGRSPVADFPERINEGSTNSNEESDVPDGISFESRHLADSCAANDSGCIGCDIRSGTEKLIPSSVSV